MRSKQQRTASLHCTREIDNVTRLRRAYIEGGNELAVKFEKRTVVDGRIIIPAKVIKNIQVLCFWARGRVRAGQPLNANNFNPATMAQAKETMCL